MAELKIKTGDETFVPGRQEAEQQKKEQASRAEKQANSLFAPPDAKTVDHGPDYGDQRIRFHKKDEINPYADAEDSRHSADPRVKKIVVAGVALFVLVVVLAIIPNHIFSVERFDTTFGGYMREVSESFKGLISTLMGRQTMYTDYFLAIAAAVVAGAALGLSGGVYQGALKNALASPSTLGVTSGGTLGIIIFAVFFYPNTLHGFSGTISDYREALASLSPFDYFMTYYGMAVCALVGCFAVVGIIMVMAIIAGRGKLSNASLIIAGQVFTAVIAVVISWIRLYLEKFGTEDQILLLTQSQSATFTGTYTIPLLLAFAIPTIICMAVIFAMSGRLTLLAFNDEEARSMGISTKFTRNFMVAVCTIMTALVISFCGPIGFVGFMVPHVARNYIGPDFRYLLPVCAIFGAMLVSFTYVLTCLGIPGMPSGSAGFFTSIVGCIMFIVMALRQRGSSNGEWF